MLAFLLSMTDDEEERAGFEVLYRAYRQDMFKTAYGVLKNKYDAEDAVSQTFMNIIGKPDITKSKPCPRIHGYLLVAVKNTSKKLLGERSRIDIEDVEEKDIADDISIEEIMDSHMKAEQIDSILMTLPESYYEIIFLKYYMELELSEISELLNITYENAKKRLFRAKRKLRELAEDMIK